MIIIKTKEEIEILREGGKRLATVLFKVKGKVAPGLSTKDLDIYAENLIRGMGDEPAFLNYRPAGAEFPFPASLCVSINDEVVHGIPSSKRILKEGDIVSIDLGLKHRGLFTDMAITVPVGVVSAGSQQLMNITEQALQVGINAAQAGGTVGDIGYAVESFIRSHKYKYGIVEVLSGHGVGRAIHEDPYIPNFGKKGKGEKLFSGMVIALEPMLNNGTKNVTLDTDGYTFRTADGKKSAHFEHTILITEGDAEILTKIN
ncbi:type I methionyl aminopeptidase [Candidatus Nomurabacteria bacterium RIFCSPHIGHO2_02_FULL_37_45]|uniref:Methionine aminopeptidase n=2 Tax=Candidatus Nomuraibacteriota TaxID=1752729 RepID=A0A1F6Y398_9BACT|nr:MAG: type I methionyl aminopeptidase [Candidatus Nomurabacteria bacterium RIFCSPHIGHO2_01_FULL_37_110]OGI72346.1 MAG: type I methionyl aminopeptidase [Candidatus Nomurabacteria bacterium RIFCSPHIGHO2_02_FULL_37_45]OGI79228.1 MAG: type I methionyl aminopeptidase [Candidatus Nomurabacteria bacterium RIFCSPHIGHO2_12_FULL_37_29]OGI85084.1 MAG: type I methionyl aminopeptidase [Candidatus Nomurabacteria bacterium RIFCSPLOWO2_01_FULL_37_49]OGJ00805.1 MAG: type I methionyl aminopeptidase [Candidatus